MYFRGLMGNECIDYDNWRKQHGCVSKVEIIYIPDEIDQTTRVRCLLCREEIDITDYGVA